MKCILYYIVMFYFSGFKDAPLSPLLPQSSYTDEQLYKDSIKLHNDYRLKHGSKPLTLNKMVCNNMYNISYCRRYF